MTDIDLIPDDYRSWLSQRALFRSYTIVFVVLISAVVAFGIALERAADRAEVRVSQLKSQNAITQQQHAQLEQLKEREAEYERQWSLLRGLRAGAAVEDIFNIIDRSLTGEDLWFVDWKFRRAGVIVNGQQRGVETGYFIIVSADERVAQEADWRVETHMAIRGQARDHQALSTFVRALFDQPGVKDVNVRKTSLTDYANGRVVEFDMAIVLNSAIRDI